MKYISLPFYFARTNYIDFHFNVIGHEERVIFLLLIFLYIACIEGDGMWLVKSK